jgi:hypothetical protein
MLKSPTFWDPRGSTVCLVLLRGFQRNYEMVTYESFVQQNLSCQSPVAVRENVTQKVSCSIFGRHHSTNVGRAVVQRSVPLVTPLSRFSLEIGFISPFLTVSRLIRYPLRGCRHVH